MEKITFHFPEEVAFGDHCFKDFISSLQDRPFKKAFILADPNIPDPLMKLTDGLDQAGIHSQIHTGIAGEPTFREFKSIRIEAERNDFDAVIGLGGGSILDVAKLIAALYRSDQSIESVTGTGKLIKRELQLICIPTTAGTGSEMSPNAILMDENDRQKKGIISPCLVPDTTIIDPVLTYTVPREVTAATGIDALTHCLEAYANLNAHPISDLYAMEGIRLIYHNLENAYKDGLNSIARYNVALGSMYGGICLGPVNTAAVHALAYPLGSEYRLTHGISNALLLPHVLRANIQAGTERYASIAATTGVANIPEREEMAAKGVENIAGLCRKVGIPEKLTGFNIRPEDVPELARSALKVERLLKNNLRKLTENDIINIYNKLF